MTGSSENGAGTTAASGDLSPPAPPTSPSLCSRCGQPFAGDEDQLVQMRGGTVVAVYHERCHPNYRRSGCAGC